MNKNNAGIRIAGNTGYLKPGLLTLLVATSLFVSGGPPVQAQTANQGRAPQQASVKRGGLLTPLELSHPPDRLPAGGRVPDPVH